MDQKHWGIIGMILLGALRELSKYMLAILLYMGVCMWVGAKMYYYDARMGRIRKRKGPMEWPVVGMLPALLWNQDRVYDWLTELLILMLEEEGRNTFRFVAPMMDAVITSDPRNVEHVLKARFGNYPKGRYSGHVFRDLLGRGIFNADGLVWALQRRRASLAVRTGAFRAHSERATWSVVRGHLLPLLRRACRLGAPLDLQDLFLRFTLQSTCLVSLGLTIDCLSEYPSASDSIVSSGASTISLGSLPFSQAFESALHATTSRFVVPLPLWKLMRSFNLGPERSLCRSLHVLDDFMADAIRRRRQELRDTAQESGDYHPPGETITGLADLLSSFILMFDELEANHKADQNTTGSTVVLRDKVEEEQKQEEAHIRRLLQDIKSSGAEDRFLRDVALSVILAGRDTTGVALAWFFWLLAKHPEAEEKVVEEIRRVKGIHNNSNNSEDGNTDDFLEFNKEDLRSMHYLHAALSESLRLYPPVPVEMKQAVEDDVLPDGTVVRAREGVLHSVYSMGRMPSIWGHDCLEFKPERWLSYNGAGLNAYSFVQRSPFLHPVFNAGPRTCLGKDLAYLQMKMAAASILSEFKVSLVHPQLRISPRVSITLYMKQGLLVTLTPRTY